MFIALATSLSEISLYSAIAVSIEFLGGALPRRGGCDVARIAAAFWTLDTRDVFPVLDYKRDRFTPVLFARW